MRHRYLFGVLAVFLGLCLYFFQLIYAEARDKAIDELNARQKIHARQARRGIEAYFDDTVALLGRLARSAHIVDMDDGAGATWPWPWNSTRAASPPSHGWTLPAASSTPSPIPRN